MKLFKRLIKRIFPDKCPTCGSKKVFTTEKGGKCKSCGNKWEDGKQIIENDELFKDDWE
ncbi:MAG: hypothetical protein WBG90_05125 [Saonia sp.]